MELNGFFKINPVDFDELLIRIDYAIFGVHPTLWLEQFALPPIVEYFQIIYATFYFLPIVLVLILCRRKDHDNVNYFICTDQRLAKASCTIPVEALAFFSPGDRTKIYIGSSATCSHNGFIVDTAHH